MKLDPYLNPTDAPIALPANSRLSVNFDQDTNYPLGKMNYSNMNKISRPYQAVVSLNREQGAFNDIQSALNYVNSLGGGRILVMPGTYVPSKQMTIYSDTFIEGLINSDCVIDFNSGTNGFITQNLGTNMSFKSLKFTNYGGTGIFDAPLILMGTSSNIYVDNCIFSSNNTGTLASDIFGSVVGGLHITNCVSSNSASFFFAQDVGITINKRSEISHCNISASGYGIKTGENTKADNFIINNNEISTIGYGRNLYAALNNSLILNNVIGNSSNTGTPTEASAVLSSNMIVMGNTFLGDGNNGTCTLSLSSSGQKATIIGNRILASGTASVQHETILIQGDYSRFIGNYIAQAGTNYTMDFRSSSGTNIAIGNVVEGGTATINNAGTGNIIANNA